MNVVGELYTEKNSCVIARFPCDSTAFLFLMLMAQLRHIYYVTLLHCIFSVLRVVAKLTTLSA